MGTAAIESTATARPPRRAALRGLARVLLFGSLGLVGADVLVGLLDADRDQVEEGLYEPDEEIGWVNRPGYRNELTSINRHGLRGPEVPTDAPPTELRVLGMGASQVYGAPTLQGSDDNPTNAEVWSAWLEDALSGTGHPWRVLNGGVKGYSAIQASRLAIRLIDELEPDLVVLFLPPDAQSLLDPSPAAQWVRIDGQLVPEDIAGAWPDVLLPVAMSAHRALSVSNLYQRHRARSRILGSRPAEIDKFLVSRAPIADERIGQMLAATFEEIGALRDACERGDVELRVAVVPHSSQYGDGTWERYLSRHQTRSAPPLGTPRSEPNEVLAGRLVEVGFVVWDLFDELAPFAERPGHYLLSDKAHWSIEGHRLVAYALAHRMGSEDGLADRLSARRGARPRD